VRDQKYNDCPVASTAGAAEQTGIGFAVYILLSRFDDHIAYYTLERIFRERHGAVIPRQQMVQWVEKIAFLLLAIYYGIWEELSATGYLQIDETPVKVLDPEVQRQSGHRLLVVLLQPSRRCVPGVLRGPGPGRPRETPG